MSIIFINSAASGRTSRLQRRARCLQHSDEPDARGRSQQLTNSDANAITSFIDECPFEQKGDSSQELAFQAGVIPSGNKKTSIHQSFTGMLPTFQA